MRALQLVAKDAGHYSRKSARVDFDILERAGCEPVRIEIDPNGDLPRDDVDSTAITLIYGASRIPQSVLRRAPGRRFADEHVSPSLVSRLLGWSQPTLVTAAPANAAGGTWLPEAVHDAYFTLPGRSSLPGGERVIGFLERGNVVRLVAEVAARISRFRDDIAILQVDSLTPEELSRVDVWLDPALEESDLDGGTAEALVAQVPVVATRTAINNQRLDGGRAGFLVPPRDPNELTHAALNALFKPEMCLPRLEEARRSRDRFRHTARETVLMDLIMGAEGGS